MSSPLKQLSLTCLLTLSSFSLMANPNEGQTTEQNSEQAAMVPMINPITGELVYVFCPEAPHCNQERPPMANLESPQDNN